MAFSTVIIAVSFLPLFTLTGVSGVIFAPMSHTYALAIGGAVLLALTLTPVLASWFLRSHAEAASKTGGWRRFFQAGIRPRDEGPVPVRHAFHRTHHPPFPRLLRHPKLPLLLIISAS